MLFRSLLPLLEPIGLVGLQAAQLVVMPLLICEVLLALGRLGQGSLPGLLRLGGLWLGLLWLIGCLAVLVMPLMLPQLAGSPFFSPSLLNPRPSIDLVRSVVPANLFQALAADNVAAIVLVCGALGVLLHRLDDREDLLRPLAVLTRLFRDLNGIVLSVLPLSVMALTAGSVRQADAELLIRLQGLLAITLVGGLVVTGVLCGLLLALLPCGMGRIWRIVAGPLGVVLGSANLMAALPLLLANLRRELASCAWGGEQDRAQAEEAMTAAVALGFALPGLGQVMGLVCVPFLAWMRDQTLSLSDQLQVLLIGVPSVSGGLKLAVREGLRQQGLPLDLLTLIDVTGVWVYRFEKGMTLLGLLSLALVVYAGALRMLRFRPLPLLLALAAAGLPAGLGGSAVHAGLAASLRGRYRNDRLVLERQAMQSHPPVMLVSLPPPAPVSLREIRGRGVLRLGVRREAMPWAYRNHSGQWVGFDLDLLRRLSIDLGIGQIQLVEGSSQDLERWLEQGRLDLLAGGLLATPGRSARFMVSDPYFIAHLGLVVADAAVRRLQDLEARPMDRPLQLAVTDSNLVTLNLRDRIDQQLGGGLTGVRIAPIASRDA